MKDHYFRTQSENFESCFKMKLNFQAIYSTFCQTHEQELKSWGKNKTKFEIKSQSHNIKSPHFGIQSQNLEP